MLWRGARILASRAHNHPSYRLQVTAGRRTLAACSPHSRPQAAPCTHLSCVVDVECSHSETVVRSARVRRRCSIAKRPSGLSVIVDVQCNPSRASERRRINGMHVWGGVWGVGRLAPPARRRGGAAWQTGLCKYGFTVGVQCKKSTVQCS